MISSRDDYQFVTGDDFQKIIVNGEIMPLRANKNILRGEDIAFLAEAASERLLLDSQTNKFSFTRRLSAQQVTSVSRLIRRIFNSTGEPATQRKLWIDGEIETDVFSRSNNVSVLDQDIFFPADRYVERTFVTGDKLEREPIAKMFDAVSGLDRFYGRENLYACWDHADFDYVTISEIGTSEPTDHNVLYDFSYLAERELEDEETVTKVMRDGEYRVDTKDYEITLEGPSEFSKSADVYAVIRMDASNNSRSDSGYILKNIGNLAGSARRLSFGDLATAAPDLCRQYLGIGPERGEPAQEVGSVFASNVTVYLSPDAWVGRLRDRTRFY